MDASAAGTRPVEIALGLFTQCHPVRAHSAPSAYCGGDIMRRLIPNALTCASLLLGFLALVASSHGLQLEAIGLVFAAVVGDMLDGVAARCLNATSDFGRELDSLADVVAFGAAPSLILYNWYFAQAGFM